MNAFFALPLELRLAIVFAAGCSVAGLINWGIYRLAYRTRPISPWGPAVAEAGKRTWGDRLPIYGWISLRREARWHGPRFWVRPLLVELGTGALWAFLYWWEVAEQAIVPPLGALAPPGAFPADLEIAVHAEVLAHMVLAALMLVASFIDIDEKIIPDAVTVPGTLLGLIAAAVFPWSLLPADAWFDAVLARQQVDFLRISSPHPWPALFEAAPNTMSLWIALAVWLGWCFALLPRRMRTRHGWRRAFRLFFARMWREPATWTIAVLAVLGGGAIAAAWWWLAPAGWAGLLSALVGLAAGGGITWIVRILGSLALRREAMGFGDVTLMAMIGAFVGWQTSLLIFFLAPFAGLFIGGFQMIMRRGQEIPYGPFLCVATLAAIIGWADLWQWARDIFEMGTLLLAILAACMLLPLVMLNLWRLLREAVTGSS